MAKLYVGHNQTPWLPLVTTASHKRMDNALSLSLSLSPHKGFFLFWFSFDVCFIEIVYDFVCLEWGFDLAFKIGLEMW